MPAECLETPVGPWIIRSRAQGAGRPIVLVHGLGTSSASWDDNIEALTACGRVYAVDLPGFGDSSCPERPLGTRELAGALLAWCEAVGLERADFVGHSLGGEICMWAALQAPERIRRLVLAASTGASPERPLDGRIGALLADGAKEPPRALPRLVKAYWQAGLLRIHHLARHSGSRGLLHALPCLWAPTLLVWGTQDEVTPLADARRLLMRLPHARLALLDAPHGLIFADPEGFNRVVCAFLEEAAPRPENDAGLALLHQAGA